MPKLWPHQVKGLRELWQLVQSGEKRLCLTSPTGGGKTHMMCELMNECRHLGKKVALYTNRIMLTSQTSAVMGENSINHGIRAAGFNPAMFRDVQICSIMTEYSRCIKRNQWDLHQADIVLADEIHNLKGAVANHIFNKHIESGATLIGFTATPLGIGHVCTKLVVAGTNSQLRDCGAHVPCITYGPDEPDMGVAGRTKMGEFKQGDIVKAIHKHTLYGRVERWWRRLNPDQRPTILFAPGVSESKWFVDQFEANGITAAHIDGRHIYIHGKEYQSTQELRDEVLRGSKSGEIKVLCNRFVLREGINAPWLYHCIMATPFGSLTSYLQAGGRLLRSYPGLAHVILQDHGGNWWRHGSLNENRNWNLAFDEFTYADARSSERKERGEKEPVCCTKCGFVRPSGAICPQCGDKCTFSFKNVIQTNGELKRMTAVQYKKSKAKRQFTDDQKAWNKCYYTIMAAARRDNGVRAHSVGEVGAYFKKMMGHYPDKNIPGVPQSSKQWKLEIQEYQRTYGGYKV